MATDTAAKIEKDFSKLRTLYTQVTKQLHLMTLKYNRLQHEKRALQLELDALKRRMGNG